MKSVGHPAYHDHIRSLMKYKYVGNRGDPEAEICVLTEHVLTFDAANGGVEVERAALGTVLVLVDHGLMRSNVGHGCLDARLTMTRAAGSRNGVAVERRAHLYDLFTADCVVMAEAHCRLCVYVSVMCEVLRGACEGVKCEVRSAKCEVRGARCEVRGARCER
ncbi:hypothetical protein BC936DRAFT_139340 [Jimgerdemannia flammicorona]|uniref:Uncharacterized protein n=1 Tax=Jimgerdemannia flammicorona TaxID=994334 RepID=A0A433BA35_9FUNG|nr:hypothetical protein BC936DRAFT_139340 [Jimgerdemannia flammicorona]